MQWVRRSWGTRCNPIPPAHCRGSIHWKLLEASESFPAGICGHSHLPPFPVTPLAGMRTESECLDPECPSGVTEWQDLQGAAIVGG